MGFITQGAADLSAAEFHREQDRKQRQLREEFEATQKKYSVESGFIERGPVHFIGTLAGFISPVPEGATGPWPTRGPGMMFMGGSGGHGFDSRTSTVRLMDKTHNQPARTVYENKTGQIVNPFTGRTDHKGGHFYHD